MKPKLILLDIFSYSCMNCLRSLDFIKKIDDKYKNFGLKTIIIHPPEWKFEKNRSNIQSASKKYKISIPIRMDKDYRIIKKFGINFWPSQILIKGNKIIYRHIGEGNYKGLESSIRKNLDIKPKKVFVSEPKYTRFPAVYCGKRKKGRILKLTKKLKFGFVYSDGKWVQKDEYLQSMEGNSFLVLLTKGKIINFVAKSINNKEIKIKVMANNKIIKRILVNKPQLYQIISLKNRNQQKLGLIAEKNLAVYSFSFQ